MDEYSNPVFLPRKMIASTAAWPMAKGAEIVCCAGSVLNMYIGVRLGGKAQITPNRKKAGVRTLVRQGRCRAQDVKLSHTRHVPVFQHFARTSRGR